MIRDLERYRFAADSMHGVGTVAIFCTACSEGAEQSVAVHVFDFLFPSIGDVQKIIAEHEDGVHGVGTEVLRLAVVLVTEGPRHGSPSMIQRRLRQDHGVAITFDEALSILDRLEVAGIVGPADGSRARAVLLDRAEALAALAETAREATR